MLIRKTTRTSERRLRGNTQQQRFGLFCYLNFSENCNQCLLSPVAKAAVFHQTPGQESLNVVQVSERVKTVVNMREDFSYKCVT